ncbi:MAG: glutaredoxin family protein [Gammaproteobacteria bacterium]
MRMTLFGTSGCHLCEQAERIVEEIRTDNAGTFEIETADIAEREDWQTRYAWLIPVLLCPETGQELAWPFSHTAAKEFILVQLESLGHDP